MNGIHEFSTCCASKRSNMHFTGPCVRQSNAVSRYPSLIAGLKNGILKGLLPTAFCAEAVNQSTEKSKYTSAYNMTVKLAQEAARKAELEGGTHQVTEREIEEYLANETGRDRLKAMYRFDNSAEKASADFHTPFWIAAACGTITFLIAGVVSGKHAREEFIESHRHTKWTSKIRAARSYNDALLLGAAKGGAKWGLRNFAFAGIFMYTSYSIAVYRNKSGIIEYIIGGVATGALLRLNLGLKGFVAGGIIGSVFGLVGGALTYLTLVGTDDTQERRHYRAVSEMLLEKKKMAAVLKVDVAESSEELAPAMETS